jgi:hypothetical protein
VRKIFGERFTRGFGFFESFESFESYESFVFGATSWGGILGIFEMKILKEKRRKKKVNYKKKTREDKRRPIVRKVVRGVEERFGERFTRGFWVFRVLSVWCEKLKGMF